MMNQVEWNTKSEGKDSKNLNVNLKTSTRHVILETMSSQMILLQDFFK